MCVRLSVCVCVCSVIRAPRSECTFAFWSSGVNIKIKLHTGNPPNLSVTPKKQKQKNPPKTNLSFSHTHTHTRIHTQYFLSLLELVVSVRFNLLPGSSSLWGTKRNPSIWVCLRMCVWLVSRGGNCLDKFNKTPRHGHSSSTRLLWINICVCEPATHCITTVYNCLIFFFLLPPPTAISLFESESYYAYHHHTHGGGWRRQQPCCDQDDWSAVCCGADLIDWWNVLLFPISHIQTRFPKICKQEILSVTKLDLNTR